MSGAAQRFRGPRRADSGPRRPPIGKHFLLGHSVVTPSADRRNRAPIPHNGCFSKTGRTRPIFWGVAPATLPKTSRCQLDTKGMNAINELRHSSNGQAERSGEDRYKLARTFARISGIRMGTLAATVPNVSGGPNGKFSPPQIVSLFLTKRLNTWAVIQTRRWKEL